MFRFVHLEDDPIDAELVAATLLEALDCEIEHVATEAAFRTALQQRPDLILADASLPGFDGVVAQQIARECCPDVPFIFVTGTLGEEQAIERLTAGASDYVLKHRLARLPAAVRRALEVADNRRGRHAAETALRELNADLERRVHERTRDLADAIGALTQSRTQLHEANVFMEKVIALSPSMIFHLDPHSFRATYVSPNVAVLLGYSPAELLELRRSWQDLVHPDDQAPVIRSIRAAIDEGATQLQQEFRYHTKDGRSRSFFNVLRIEYLANGRPVSILGHALDVTDTKVVSSL